MTGDQNADQLNPMPKKKAIKKKRGARGPAKGEGGRPRGPATERLNWRLPVGTVAGIERLAKADGLTGPAYLAALAGVQNVQDHSPMGAGSASNPESNPAAPIG